MRYGQSDFTITSATYVYIQSEPGIWTVGHYDPHGLWIAESDHTKPEEAAARVNYLNGGLRTSLQRRINAL